MLNNLILHLIVKCVKHEDEIMLEEKVGEGKTY